MAYTDLSRREHVPPHVHEFAEHAQGAALGDLSQASDHRQLRVSHSHVRLKAEEQQSKGTKAKEHRTGRTVEFRCGEEQLVIGPVFIGN